MLTGYLASFPNDALLDNGIIKIGANIWGVTKGQSSFTPGSTIVNSDFDGKTVPLKGLDRLLHGEPIIQFTALELGPSASGNQIAKLLPGSTEATTGSTPNTKTTITPLSGNQFLVAGNYLVDFRLIFERAIVTGAGVKKYAALYMPLALVIEWGPLQGNNKDHPTYSCKVAGRTDPGGGGDLSPSAYKIELLESLP
jgi:hypothetical protein